MRGPGFAHTTDVDPDTGGYAVGVPEVTLATWTDGAGKLVAVVDFLDGSGRVVDTR